MKHASILFLSLLAVIGCAQKEKTVRPITPVSFADVTIQDAFWSPRLDRHKEVTLPVCIDQIENQTGRIRNFENAALGKGEHSGIFFDDSDVYKALEGMAYSLRIHPDPALEAKCDEWIDKFAAAQQPDGYINTYYTLTGLENRWDDMDKHEMYCAGHLIEAAVAYYDATGKRKLLDVGIRMADHMMSIFGPGKRDWVPGHEEIELALVKLYHTTGERKYLEFADWLLGERGRGFGSRGKSGKQWKPEYYQDEVPVREMTDISGHAVRSMYLFCGMADVTAETGDKGYMEALDRLWDDVVLRNMYITGGIGQSAGNEGFTEDYDLPNLTAYCETCASVGMVLWNARMNRFSGDAKYADVMERSLYNGALSGISLAGDRFFYVNPLESKGDHHRKAWYGCACCPSQICRFLPSIGGYIYGTSDKAVWVNLYIGNTARFQVGGTPVTLSQETRYPWDGEITLKISPEKPITTEIRLRIPDWCKSYSVSVNGTALEPVIEKGYAVISREWSDGDQVTLAMDMPVEVVEAPSRVKGNRGKRAIQRGPIVYCLEETDNPEGFDGLKIPGNASFEARFEEDLLDGVVAIKAVSGDQVLHYIPYYAWDNREAGKMKVWVDFDASTQKPVTPNYVHLKTYAEANAELPEPGRKTRRVVFIGDSITELWGHTADPEFFRNGRYVERGISGEVTAQMVLRFRQDVIDLKPWAVVINGGTNDIALNQGAYDEDYTFGNIVSMVEMAKAHKIKVILTSVLPAAKYRWRPEVTDSSEKILALNARIEAYAKANRIPYVDYYTPLLADDGKSLNPAYTKDGVHPIKEGYLVMEPLVEQYLR